MKIFIAEYVIFYETFDFNWFEELNMIDIFFEYSYYFDSLYRLHYRFVLKKTYFIYDICNNLFLRKKQYTHDFFWKRFLLRRNFFFRLIPWYFLPRKWLKYYQFWTPMCYKFFQYSYINELVKHFYVNHLQYDVFRIEFPKLESALIFDHSHLQFPRRLVYDFERKRWYGLSSMVFYRSRPYVLEYLPYQLYLYKNGTLVPILNPHNKYFSGGEIPVYARKWVSYTYMIYNEERQRPFIVYGYWTSNFFTEIFLFRVLHYKYEFFRDSISFMETIIGTVDNIKFILYIILNCYLFYYLLFWFSIFFAIFYSKEKMIRMLVLEEYISTLEWFYSIYFNKFVVLQDIIRRWKIKRLKWEGRTITYKSQLESRFLRILKNYIYFPYSFWYFKNIVNTKQYINKIEKNFLGDISFYRSEENYIYLFLIIITWPLRVLYGVKNIFYWIHIFYYLYLNKVIHYFVIYNPRINYVFNRFFNSNIVYRRDLDRYSSFAIMERFLNYKNLYTNKEFKELITNYVYYLYQVNLYSKTGKRREEYYDYFYFRTFGNYEPEREFFDIIKMRFFTRLWYYKLDFSDKLLITHRFFEFFNFILSPLHIRLNSINIYNFYYVLFFSKYYYYYYYYIYYFFSNGINLNLFSIYINYFFFFNFYFFSIVNKCFNFFFDGKKSYIYIFFFHKMYIFYLFLINKYIFFKIFIQLFNCLNLTIYYIFYFIFVNIFNILNILYFNLLNFFSALFVNNFKLNYRFWYRYYIIKFYLIEYNILLYFFKFIINFFFNFFLFIVFILFILSIPSIQELVTSDYLIYFIYSLINKIFVYNKLIYFDQVLDNWDVPFFDSRKFINFYNGYLNFFEIRLKNLFSNLIVETGSLNKRKYIYNKEFFELYFKKYLSYLQLIKFSSLNRMFRILFQDSFPWELYIYMSTYFWYVKHPARHFMLDIFFNTMPISVSFILRYKYFLLLSKIFVPLYWVWKYSYSYLVFICLYYTNNTFFFNFFLGFFKFWYNIYILLNYYWYYFCYYYFYFFLFTISKLIRYYFVTYDIFYYFWIYRSARFIIALDFFNFCRFNFDIIYYLLYIFIYFFKIIYNFIYYIFNFCGLTSIYNYYIFSGNIISRLHLFISEWFDKFITLNYEIDEYGRILHKYFRHNTRGRVGEWLKRDIAVRSFYKVKHRTTDFEFFFREFLFYTKRGLMHNFLIHNNVKVNTFNLFFFSFLAIYLHYMFLVFFLSLVSFRLRIFFKDETYLNFTPFFEWERFNKKNRHLLGRVEFYWLYNIRWFKNFEFYIDKHFTDDLYARIFDHREIRLGFFVYDSFMNFFVYNEKNFNETLKYNKFLVYKRYFIERYLCIIKNIDFIFYEYMISNKDDQQMIFFNYDFFIPIYDEKKFEFNFKKDFVKNFNYLDYYWLYFAIPQLFYTRNWNTLRVINKDEIYKNLFLKIKKSLFKAYSYYEMNGLEAPYDLFEFQFFEPHVYDAFLFENANSKHYSKKTNRFLQKVALSRWNMELVYEIPGKNFFEMYAHAGYHDWMNKFEFYLDYLRSINETYLNNMIDLGIYSFFKSIHNIVTHMDADVVKSSIDLSIDDSAIGVKYSELYQYEDLGRVATEQYLFKFLEKAFYRSLDDPSMSSVALSDDITVTQRHVTTWTVLVLILPLIMIFFFFINYIYFSRLIFPHTFLRELIYYILYHILSIFDAEVFIFNKLFSLEHERQSYWLSPWLWTRTYIFDLYWIDRYSFWTGKYAKFLQAKEEYLWFFFIFSNDKFRFDNLSFLYWNFYIVAWKECKESVIFFILLDIIFYLLCILFLLFFFNFFIYLKEFLRYFFKKSNLIVDSDFDLDKYRNEKDKKKVNVFEFIDMDVFKDYRGRVNLYERNKKKKI